MQWQPLARYKLDDLLRGVYQLLEGKQKHKGVLSHKMLCYQMPCTLTLSIT